MAAMGTPGWSRRCSWAWRRLAPISARVICRTGTWSIAQVMTQDLYPRLINQIRDLAGGSLIMLPSSFRDWANPELTPVLRKTQRSANFTSEDKVKLLKTAWDAVGSEFASRHTQYEMFYAGARFVA